MTNQNPASINPKSSKLERDILAKVNAHADRSIDRVFADIDELLSGDLTAETQSPSVNHPPQRPRHSAELAQADTQRQPPPSPDTPLRNSADLTSPPAVERKLLPPATSKPQKQRSPLWVKTFVGIGITSIALSSLLLWLINERKIQLPKNIDTSWLPFQSQSQISPEDAKFAEYMRKSISKIESANQQSNLTGNRSNPTNIATQNQSTATLPDPIGVVTTTPTANTPASKTPISLLKTFQTSNPPGAIFEIDRQSQTVTVGQKIGTSNWSLLTVAKGEVIIKRAGGEIRSIYVGQKF